MIYSHTQIASIFAARAATAIAIWMAGEKKKRAPRWSSAAASKGRLAAYFPGRTVRLSYSRNGVLSATLRLNTEGRVLGPPRSSGSPSA